MTMQWITQKLSVNSKKEKNIHHNGKIRSKTTTLRSPSTTHMKNQSIWKLKNKLLIIGLKKKSRFKLQII